MNSEKIVAYLSFISNRNLIVNVFLHIAVFALLSLIFLSKNNKIRKYAINTSVIMLTGSVIINAILGRSIFHIITFGILLIAGLYGAKKMNNDFCKGSMDINTIIALIFIIIGVWYPEFVKCNNVFSYFIFSPMGIVPCPTLITILGMLNLFVKSINKKQFITTIIIAIVYGIIGTFIFKVYFDMWLIAAVIYSGYNMYKRKCQCLIV